ncbi:hypothetical protein LZL87_008761 [Fusarium oxysporum]|nr:hypothetical protein LZL87_008761 [Fusarium oxysporum]
MAPITAVRGDHTKWQCMTTVNGQCCEVNDMFEFGQDDRVRTIRVPIRACPKCKLVRGILTLALRENWDIIGHLKNYTALGEEIWKYRVPYDVDEPGPIVDRTVAEFTDGDVVYEEGADGSTTSGS